MEKGKIIQNDILGTDESYERYRIPGMLVTDRGTLIVYNEARRDPSDWALMDIIMRRSENHGESFRDVTVLASGTEELKTVNNPVMLQDRNGRIHFLYCQDYGVGGGRIFRRFSDNDGIDWSEPYDITDFTMPDFRNCFALGPGHGIRTENGTLLVPVWMIPKHCGSHLRSHGPSVISTFYSTDDGESWQVGELLGTTPETITPNETAAALLSDGRVYLNCRFGGGLNYRGQAISDNGHSGWYDYRPVRELTDPGCFGSVSAYNDGKNPYTLVFANCENKRFRKNVTVKGSTDDGKSWTLRRVLDAGRGGYVETATDSRNGLIYVLYEEQAGVTDALAVFDYEWLAAGEPNEE